MNAPPRHGVGGTRFLPRHVGWAHLGAFFSSMAQGHRQPPVASLLVVGDQWQARVRLPAYFWPPLGRLLLAASSWPPSLDHLFLAASSWPATPSHRLLAACCWLRTTGRRHWPPVGRPLLAASCSSLANGRLLLAVSSWLPAPGRFLRAAWYWPPASGRMVLAACSVLTACYWPPTTDPSY